MLVRVIDPDFRDHYPSFPANARRIVEWRRACRACEDVAALKTHQTTMTGPDDSEQLEEARVTVNFFDLLGNEHEIVGVLPLRAPIPGPEQLGGLVRIATRIDIYRPAAFTDEQLGSRGHFDYGAIARLRQRGESTSMRSARRSFEAGPSPTPIAGGRSSSCPLRRRVSSLAMAIRSGVRCRPAVRSAR